jgi:hypothetical protein
MTVLPLPLGRPLFNLSRFLPQINDREMKQSHCLIDRSPWERGVFSDVIAPPGELFSETNDNSVAILITRGTACVVLDCDGEVGKGNTAIVPCTRPYGPSRFETTERSERRSSARLTEGGIGVLFRHEGFDRWALNVGPEFDCASAIASSIRGASLRAAQSWMSTLQLPCAPVVAGVHYIRGSLRNFKPGFLFDHTPDF